MMACSLANWVVACSLAGCLAGPRTGGRGWQAGYLGGPVDLDLAGCLSWLSAIWLCWLLG